MINKFNKLKNFIRGVYLYSGEKAFREILKFYISEKKECFNYFHIPKTGGKYIKRILKNNLDHNQFKAYEHIVKLKWINPNSKVIISIRDPIERIISCYYSDIRNFEINNVQLGKFGTSLYKKFPTLEMALQGFINNDKDIGLLTQLGLLSSISYWGEEKHFSKIKNLTVIRTEFLKEDVFAFLQKEFPNLKNWNNVINTFEGEKLRQTSKNDYDIDPILKNDLKLFLNKEYELYNYLLDRRN